MPTPGRLSELKRPALLLSALLRGDSLDRQTVARMLGIKVAAADRQLRALLALKGVKKRRDRGKSLYSFEAPVEEPTLASLVAAGLAASFARLFEGSDYMTGMREVRDALISRAPRRHRFRSIERKLFFLLQGGEQAITQPESPLEEVVQAVLEEKRLRMHYEHFDGTRERVTVSPLSLMVYRQQLYMVALKSDRKPHPFRVARLLSAAVDKPFTYPADYDPSVVYRDAFGVFIPSAAPEVVRLRLSAHWKTFIRTHRWHPTQEVEADGVTVRISVSPCREVEQWILSFGEDAEVLEPAVLRAKIAARLKSATARYGTASHASPAEAPK
jgi:proteasome accessory factor C